MVVRYGVYLSAEFDEPMDVDATNGLELFVVDLQDVYDQFGHGSKDPAAIRNYVKFLYEIDGQPRILLNNWMMARETALGRVRAIRQAAPEAIETVRRLLARARRHLDQWTVEDARQSRRIETLKSELAEIGTLATALVQSSSTVTAVIVGLVAGGAARYPDRVAIHDDEGSITYAELWARSRSIADTP